MPTPTSETSEHDPARRQPGRRGRDAIRARGVRAGRVARLTLAAVVVAAAFGPGGSAASAAVQPLPPVPPVTAPEAPSRYQGQVSCSVGETPGAAALRDLVRAAYGRANAGGTWRACGQGGKSEHKEGRAYDWMNNVSDPAQKAMADSFVAWLTGPDAQGVPGGNAHRLGVQYVIWNRMTWQSWTGAWKAYTGASPHTDHVHVSLSWDGAFKRTSWWTGRAVTQPDLGPCQVYVGELAPPYSGPRYGSCPPPVHRSSTATGAVMGPGQVLPMDGVLSSSRGVRLITQQDGNVVLYAPGGRPMFHTATFGHRGARLVMQTDGNVVVYSPDNRALYHTGTYGNPGASLVVQDDGNLVVYRSDGRPVWATGSRY